MRLLSKLVFILSETVGTALPSLFAVNVYFTLLYLYSGNIIPLSNLQKKIIGII